MFSRKNSKDNAEITLVGDGSRVNGDVNFSNRCVVKGIVKGDVSADTDAHSELIVTEDGTIEGSVTAPYVVLQGLVRGDVVASQRIELAETARVIGNVYYNLIEMKVGAEINGKLVHQPEGKVPLLEQTTTNLDETISTATSNG